MSNTLTNSNQFYENADITQNFTMRKDWNFEFISAAFGGIYNITDWFNKLKGREKHFSPLILIKEQKEYKGV